MTKTKKPDPGTLEWYMTLSDPSLEVIVRVHGLRPDEVSQHTYRMASAILLTRRHPGIQKMVNRSGSEFWRCDDCKMVCSDPAWMLNKACEPL